MDPDVLSALPLDDRRVKVTFSNGETRVFDISPFLDLPVFQPLKQPHLFRSVRVEHGTLAWPQEVDLCSATVYARSVPI